MDLAGMKRRELQALCKRHGLPAGGTNVALVARLDAALSRAAGAEEGVAGVPAAKGCLKQTGGDAAEAKKVSFAAEEGRARSLRTRVIWSPIVDKAKTRGKFAQASTDSAAAADDGVSAEVGANVPLRRSRRKSIVAAEAEEVGEAVAVDRKRKRKNQDNDESVAVTVSAQVGVSSRVTRRSSLAGVALVLPPAVEKKRGRGRAAGGSSKIAAEAQECDSDVRNSAEVEASARITRSRRSIAPVVVSPNVVENKRRKTEDPRANVELPTVSDVPRNDAPVTRSLRGRVVQVNNSMVAEIHIASQLESKTQPSRPPTRRHQQVSSSVEDKNQEQTAAPKKAPILRRSGRIHSEDAEKQLEVKEPVKRSTRKSVALATLEKEENDLIEEKNPAAHVRRSTRKSIVPVKDIKGIGEKIHNANREDVVKQPATKVPVRGSRRKTVVPEFHEKEKGLITEKNMEVHEGKSKRKPVMPVKNIKAVGEGIKNAKGKDVKKQFVVKQPTRRSSRKSVMPDMLEKNSGLIAAEMKAEKNVRRSTRKYVKDIPNEKDNTGGRSSKRRRTTASEEMRSVKEGNDDIIIREATKDAHTAIHEYKESGSRVQESGQVNVTREEHSSGPLLVTQKLADKISTAQSVPVVILGSESGDSPNESSDKSKQEHSGIQAVDTHLSGTSAELDQSSCIAGPVLHNFDVSEDKSLMGKDGLSIDFTVGDHEEQSPVSREGRLSLEANASEPGENDLANVMSTGLNAKSLQQDTDIIAKETDKDVLPMAFPIEEHGEKYAVSAVAVEKSIGWDTSACESAGKPITGIFYNDLHTKHLQHDYDMLAKETGEASGAAPPISELVTIPLEGSAAVCNLPVVNADKGCSSDGRPSSFGLELMFAEVLKESYSKNVENAFGDCEEQSPISGEGRVGMEANVSESGEKNSADIMSTGLYAKSLQHDTDIIAEETGKVAGESIQAPDLGKCPSRCSIGNGLSMTLLTSLHLEGAADDTSLPVLNADKGCSSDGRSLSFDLDLIFAEECKESCSRNADNNAVEIDGGNNPSTLVTSCFHVRSNCLEDEDVQPTQCEADKKLDVDEGVAEEDFAQEKTNDQHVPAKTDLNMKLNDELAGPGAECITEKNARLVADNLDEQAIMLAQHGGLKKPSPCSTTPVCKHKFGLPEETVLHPKNTGSLSSLEQSPFGLESLFSHENIDESMGSATARTKNGFDDSKDCHVKSALENTHVLEPYSYDDTERGISKNDDYMLTSQRDNGIEGSPEANLDEARVLSAFSLDAKHIKEVINFEEVACEGEGSKKFVHSEVLKASSEKINANGPDGNAYGINDAGLSSALHTPASDNYEICLGSNTEVLHQDALENEGALSEEAACTMKNYAATCSSNPRDLLMELQSLFSKGNTKESDPHENLAFPSGENSGVSHLDELVGCSNTEVLHQGHNHKDGSNVVRVEQVASEPCTNDIVEAAATAKCTESELVLPPSEERSNLNDGQLNPRLESPNIIVSGLNYDKDVCNISDNASVVVVVGERTPSGSVLDGFSVESSLQGTIFGKTIVSGVAAIGNPSSSLATPDYKYEGALSEEAVCRMKNYTGTSSVDPRHLVMDLQFLFSEGSTKKSDLQDNLAFPCAESDLADDAHLIERDNAVAVEVLCEEKVERESMPISDSDILQEKSYSNGHAIGNPSSSLATPDYKYEGALSEEAVCRMKNTGTSSVDPRHLVMDLQFLFSEGSTKKSDLQDNLAFPSAESDLADDAHLIERDNAMAVEVLCEEKVESESMPISDSDILQEKSYSNGHGICQSHSQKHIIEANSRLSSCGTEVLHQDHKEECSRPNEDKFSPKALVENNMTEDAPIEGMESSAILPLVAGTAKIPDEQLKTKMSETKMSDESEEVSFSCGKDTIENFCTGPAKGELYSLPKDFHIDSCQEQEVPEVLSLPKSPEESAKFKCASVSGSGPCQQRVNESSSIHVTYNIDEAVNQDHEEYNQNNEDQTTPDALASSVPEAVEIEIEQSEIEIGLIPATETSVLPVPYEQPNSKLEGNGDQITPGIPASSVPEAIEMEIEQSEMEIGLIPATETSVLPVPDEQPNSKLESNEDQIIPGISASSVPEAVEIEQSQMEMGLIPREETSVLPVPDEQPNSKLEGNEVDEHSCSYGKDFFILSDSESLRREASSLNKDGCMDLNSEDHPNDLPAPRSPEPSAYIQNDNESGSVGISQSSKRSGISELRAKLQSFKVSSIVKGSYIAMSAPRPKPGDSMTQSAAALLRNIENTPAVKALHLVKPNADGKDSSRRALQPISGRPREH